MGGGILGPQPSDIPGRVTPCSDELNKGLRELVFGGFCSAMSATEAGGFSEETARELGLHWASFGCRKAEECPCLTLMGRKMR